MERLRCVVERITYQNEQNGYSVIKCREKGYSGLVTVVGAIRRSMWAQSFPSPANGKWIPNTEDSRH